MKCATCHSLVDDYLDRQLNVELRGEIDEHLTFCSACAARYREAELLKNDLASMQPLCVDRAFIQTQISQIKWQARRQRWNSLAIAASILISAVVLAISFSPNKPSESEIRLFVQKEQTVNIAFNTPEALSNVTIRLTLPDNIQLATNSELRVISWNTSLPKGENILPLPIIATQSMSGEIVAELLLGNNTKTFRVKIQSVADLSHTSLTPQGDLS
jgi:hypothetical protein